MINQLKWLLLAFVCAFPLWGSLIVFYLIGINFFVPGVDPLVYLVLLGIFDIFLIADHSDIVFSNFAKYIALSFIAFLLSFIVLLSIGMAADDWRGLVAFIVLLYVVHVVDILIVPFEVYLSVEKNKK